MALKVSDRLKLRHLEVFVEVARQKSVGRAGERLALTQPAVSRTLRELEQVLGKPLLEREGRGIRLSPFGEMFLGHAGASLAAARNGLEALTRIDRAERPLVRIGALPTVSGSVLPGAVARFRAAGRVGRLRISTGENEQLLDRLRAGNLDLVVGRLPPPERMVALSFEPLYREEVVVVVAAGHPLANRARITAEDIGAHPMLMPGPGSIIRPFAERLFVEHGLPIPPDAVETVSAGIGRGMTRDHGALWVISRGVVEDDLATGRLVALPIDTRSTWGAVGLCLRTGRELSNEEAALVTALREVCADRQARLPPPA